ncbi:MAG: RHS repeat-associated core domain-containing protein, partial [Candidatus Paceibacterota bacterium]
MTDASGSIVERYAYTAYGQPTFLDASGTVLTASAEDNRYTYTGREWDEPLRLYHYRARMYDAAEGRFLGRDPIGFGGGTVNLYEYVGSQPQKWVDPTGLQWTAGRNPPPGYGSPTGGGSLPARPKPKPKPVNKKPRTSGPNRVRVTNGVTECRTNTPGPGPVAAPNGCGGAGSLINPPDDFGNF